ncbi:MAG: hypothetical protein R8G66_33130 [Cytophagales bacterium]|nr:hypothetical protein [Cytophagales bacterium]
MRTILPQILIHIVVALALTLPRAAEAQLSPLFQTPSMNMDLPVFNPAFTGDADKFRFYSMAITQKPDVNSLFGNNIYVLGYDSKTDHKKSSVQFTYGVSMIHNQISLDLENSPDVSNSGQAESFGVGYGNIEVAFGGRIPTGDIFRKEKKLRRPVRQKAGYRKRKEFKDIRKMPVETQIFLAPVAKSQVCSDKTLEDFLAFDFVVEFNYLTISSENGAIFGNQIMTNPIGSSTPFFIDFNVADPSLDPPALDNIGKIDLGAGVLWQHGFKKYGSLMRVSYAIRHLTRSNLTLNEAAQRNRLLKTFHASYKSFIGKHMGFHASIMNLQQDTEYHPVLFGEINQWRTDVSTPIFRKSFKRENVIRKGKYHRLSVEPGLSAFIFDKKVRSISGFVGMRFRKSQIDPNDPTNNETVAKINNEKKDTGNIIYAFLNWNVFTSEDIAFRDTYGNLTFGVTIEGWLNR